MAKEAITFDSLHDDPTVLSEQEQLERFEDIADSLGSLALPELVLA